MKHHRKLNNDEHRKAIVQSEIKAAGFYIDLLMSHAWDKASDKLTRKHVLDLHKQATGRLKAIKNLTR